MNVQQLVPLSRCPKCGVLAIVALTPEQRLGQPDDTTHVCHPSLGGCNHGFTDERTREPVARAVVVILVTKGFTADYIREQLTNTPGIGAVEWSKSEREGAVVCVAARVTCAVPVVEVRENLRVLASSTGWSITVAPCPGVVAEPVTRPTPSFGAFDFTSQHRRPSLVQIIGKWMQAGKPKHFTVTYGETFAEFELVNGRWDDSGNGCRGVNRQAVVDALGGAQ